MTATPIDLLHAAEAAIAAGSRDPEDYNRVAWARVQQGDTEAGFGLLHAALRIAPRDPVTLTSLGMLLHRAGHLRDAILHCDAALENDPAHVDAWVERGQIFTSGASTKSAIECFAHALTLAPDHPVAHAGLAAAYARDGDTDRTRLHATRALALDPDNAVALIALARTDLEAGDAAAVLALLAPAAERLSPFDGNAALIANLLGDAHARLRAPVAAHDCYVRSKALFAQRHADPAGAAPTHRDLVIAATAALAQTDRADWAVPVASAPAPAQPHVFVLGYPRSGNTLMENILASLPGMAALEERPTLGALDSTLFVTPEGMAQLATMDAAHCAHYRRAYWDKVAACGITLTGQGFVDMDPLKSLRLPAIARLFPAAKVIWMRRDPRDVVWSCFHTFFAPSNVSLEFVSIERTARHFSAVMELIEVAIDRLPLQVLPVDYHDLVNDFDATTAKVCDFIGVPWTDALRRFDRTARTRGVSTASVSQVRQGLYDGSRQWSQFADYLAPVQPILQRWIDAFGQK